MDQSDSPQTRREVPVQPRIGGDGVRDTCSSTHSRPSRRYIYIYIEFPASMTTLVPSTPATVSRPTSRLAPTSLRDALREKLLFTWPHSCARALVE